MIKRSRPVNVSHVLKYLILEKFVTNKLNLRLRTCWEKLWLMKVASKARFLGEFRLVPSSWGGSAAVSLTVSKSAKL